MNLGKHYNNLYNESVQKILSDDYQIDHLIDSPEDNRSGITLIIRPDIEVLDNIQSFLIDLKAIDPRQYYYPGSDIHVTVMSVISCYKGFELSQISVPDYIKVFQKSIKKIKPIEIEFRGVTASPSCIMIQGFLRDEMLNEIRNALRINFNNSNLQQSIDERYSIQTAHATVVRFRKQIVNKVDYLSTIEKWRNYNFGVSSIRSLEFVNNDWYQRKERVKELYRFNF
jgi:2'-5' RNA ligase